MFPGLVVADRLPATEEDIVQLRRELVILIVAIRRARDILLDDFGPNLVKKDEL